MGIRVAHVEAVDAHRPTAHVIEPGHEVRDRGLAGSGRADEGHHLAGGHGERDVVEHLLAWGLVEYGHALEGRERDFLGGRIGETHRVEHHLSRPTGDLHRARALGDHRREVENFEDPVERDERRHHVHLHVRERGEGPVKPVQVRSQGNDCPDEEDAPGGLGPTPSVDNRGGEGCREQQGSHEDGSVHRSRDADVAHPGCSLAEQRRFGVRVSEELDEQRPGDVEALGHGVVHLCIERVALPGERR